jgi:hypothetical protein
MGKPVTRIELVASPLPRLLSLGSSRDLEELPGISDPVLIQFSISLAVAVPGMIAVS